MKKTSMLIVAVLFFTSCNEAVKRIDYPQTKKDENVVDDYFGIKVKDPYRWLEDDNSEETKTWVDKQISVTQGVLSKIPFRDKVQKRFEELMKYPKEGAPFKRGKYYFVYKNDGNQNQNVLYIKENIDAEEHEILNPNTMSDEGTISLNGIYVSKDSKYMAYSISSGGSDWKKVFVKDLETKQDLKDEINWIKFSGIAWYGDGFYYARFPQPKEGDNLKGSNKNCRIYYHKIGTSQDGDELIFELPENPDWGMSVQIKGKSDYLLININNATYGNRLYAKNLKTNKVYKIVDNFDREYDVIDEKNDELFLITDSDAPNRKLISLNIKTGNKKDIISEKDYVLTNASVLEDKIIVNYTKDVHSKIEVFSKNGEYIYDVEFPQKIATITGGDVEENVDFTFFNINTFTSVGDIYKYDIKNNKIELYKKSQVKFDDSNYETKQVFYESKDGVKIPMFITHKKGLKLDGNRPTLLYGYGGFNISLTPRYNPRAVLMIENDGVYVQANIRGGGEYGEEWHSAGTKMNKQNVFDDFIFAAQYLIDNKYTSSQKLAINGGSNGGLLIGAVTNQRPDLVKVAIPQVGVMDMLRYQNFTIGRYWATDYGTSQDSKEMFEYLYKYSPIHNVKENIDYPNIMVTTGDHDDRVVPAHSFKYIAEIQDKYKGKNTTIIRIDKNAGHGAGKPVNKHIEENTDIISFIFYSMQETI